MTVKIEGRYGDMARFSWFFNNNKNNLDQDKNQEYFLHILIVSKIPNCSSLNAYEHLKVVTVLLFNMICDWVWLCQKKRLLTERQEDFGFLLIFGQNSVMDLGTPEWCKCTSWFWEKCTTPSLLGLILTILEKVLLCVQHSFEIPKSISEI